VRLEGGVQREQLIEQHEIECAMPTLLLRLAAPDCPKKADLQWARCGVHYVESTRSGV
jgi:hypothetical protein